MQKKKKNGSVVGLLWLKWAGLSPAVLDPSILSKGVETGPIATQLGPVCAQAMPRLPGKVGWAGLSPAVLDPSILSKGVETGPTATQLGPIDAQTMLRLPEAHLRQVELF